MGINRFSLGVQTFADWGLELLGRHHSSADVVGTVKMMNRCGVENLSIDLIYAYPGQTLIGLRRIWNRPSVWNRHISPPIVWHSNQVHRWRKR